VDSRITDLQRAVNIGQFTRSRPGHARDDDDACVQTTKITNTKRQQQQLSQQNTDDLYIR